MVSGGGVYACVPGVVRLRVLQTHGAARVVLVEEVCGARQVDYVAHTLVL
jgi:hypothetical protein